MKIEIKNRLTGSVLFSHSCKNNTIAITLSKAIKDGASLCWADLCGADLREVNFHGANFRWADLSGTDLRWANLSLVDLYGADLHESNLYGANLCGTDLPETDLVINDRYHIHIRKDYIRIGCERHTPPWWKKLSYKAADRIDNAGDWWKHWKPIVLAIHEILKNKGA